MKQISFNDIYILGQTVKDNSQFTQYHYKEMLNRYDSNLIKFKQYPSLTEFKDTERYLREFHRINGQNHLKFLFPPDIKPYREIEVYMRQAGYEIGFLELHTIQPKDFPVLKPENDIAVQTVTTETLDLFLKLQYQQDLENGTEFAEQKSALIKRQFDDPKIHQIIAFYKGIPAGYVDAILSEQTIEIDNLTVDERFRNKGIGSRLQAFIMNSYPDKTVILVADGEDTARIMYQKQNYLYQGFRYEAKKIFNEINE